MKKYLTLISCVALFSAFNAQAAMSYECYGYKDGKPVSALSSHVTVMADSKAEAEVKAIKKIRRKWHQSRLCKLPLNRTLSFTYLKDLRLVL